MANAVPAVEMGTVAPGQVVMESSGANLEAHLSKHQKLLIPPFDGSTLVVVNHNAFQIKCFITDEGGQPVFDVELSCPDREKTKMDCIIRPAGGTQPLVHIVRTKFVMFANTPADVLCDEQPYGQVRVVAGMPAKVVVQRDGFDQMVASNVCCQPKCQLFTLGAVCFLPTLAIGGCICCCLASSMDDYRLLQTSEGKDLGKLWTRKDKVELDMSSMDAPQKKDLLVMGVFSVINELCKPPQNNNGGGGGGGGGA